METRDKVLLVLSGASIVLNAVLVKKGIAPWRSRLALASAVASFGSQLAKNKDVIREFSDALVDRVGEWIDAEAEDALPAAAK